MAVSVSALSLKTILAYILIFGCFGAPALGIMGAAVATVVARCLECIAMTTITYARKLPAAARLAELLDLNRGLVSQFARTATPVILGEMLWSVGMNDLHRCLRPYRHQFCRRGEHRRHDRGGALVPFMALANAAAIMLGNRIGAGKVADAMGLRPAIRRSQRRRCDGDRMHHLHQPRPVDVPVSHLTGSTDRRGGVLAVMAVALWLKAGNLTMIVGSCAAGRHALRLPGRHRPMWLLGIPIALLSAFVLALPIYWVVLLVVMVDEGTKFIVSLWRVRSALWIHGMVYAT